MSVDAASLMARAADLTHRAADLIAAGRLEEAEAVDREAAQLRHRAMREARRTAGQAPSGLYAPAESERLTAIEALTELDAIAPPRLVSDYASARYGRSLTPRLFSSLRRDEREAWKRGASSRPVFVVPALEGSFFTQARANLALSTWPLPRRLIGPRTGRVELLRAAQNVLRHLSWISDTDDIAASKMERLVITLVRTVPGALEGWSVQDRQRALEAVERELALLQDDDFAWRDAAAERAEGVLDGYEQVWGARVPHVVRDASEAR